MDDVNFVYNNKNYLIKFNVSVYEVWATDENSKYLFIGEFTTIGECISHLMKLAADGKV